MLTLEDSPLFIRQFERHASMRPSACAARFKDQSLTYQQLNQRADLLAHNLMARGLQKGDRVVVCVPPSFAILISLLAVHKCGAVYVPLDPGFPVVRIQAILEEVQPSAIVYEQTGHLFVAENIDHSLDLASLDFNCADAVQPVQRPLTPSDHSHVFFTSGTTGKPKGVLANQANLVYYLQSAIRKYGFTEHDKFISAARYTFSISLFELLIPLMVGAEVNLLPRESVLDLAELSAIVRHATVFHFGPSLLKQLLPYIEQHYPDLTVFDGLHHVSSGGDMVPPEILEKLKNIFKKAEVYVIYGSSEISCMGCTFPVLRDAAVTRSRVGKPFETVDVKILNASQLPTALNEVGQLYFASEGLVTGYLNQPELTAEKFIMLDGRRYYSIGDVGRWDEQGDIELLGRQDFQVQVRGMRVELLEIEQLLKALPQVQDAVVVAKKLTEEADPSLVAYLVIKPDMTVEAFDLADYLSKQLPDYMVPAQFVRLDKMPLNHNGKLDRSQLPIPSDDNLLLSGGFVAADTLIQTELVGILQSFFSIQKIGIDHSFFELGGDSITAVRYLMEVDKRFGRFIPISFLLNYPTIRDLADIIENEKPIPGVGDVVVLRHGDNTQPPLFCLYGVLLYRDLAQALNTPRTVCGVFLEEEVLLLQGEANISSLDMLDTYAIAQRYYKSIKAYQTQGPYYLLGESFGGIVAMEVARIMEAAGEKVALTAMLDSFAPGYWSRMSRKQRLVRHFKMILKEGLGYIIKKLKKRFNPSVFDEVQAVSDKRDDVLSVISRTYKPVPFTGQVVLCRASNPNEFAPDLKDLGWGHYIPNMTVYEVQGDHLGMLQVPHVSDMASKLMPYLK